MNTEIFLPIFYMLCLTIVVFLFSTLIRLKEIYLNDKSNAVSGSEHKHPPFHQGSDTLKNAQRNLANLFEFPIFFYLVCIIIVLTFICNLHNIHDWICNKLSNLSLIIFRR